jgi:hypothetical protein
MEPHLVLKAVETGLKVVKAARVIDGPSKAQQEQWDRAIAQVEREVLQITHAAVRAILANALGVEPTSEQMNALLESGANDPAFPFRMHRLLGEAKKTAFREKRALLVAALYGLPCSSMSGADRERIDRLIETLLPPEIALLNTIDRMETDLAQVEKGKLGATWLAGLYAVRDRKEAFRVVSGHQLREEVFSADLFSIPDLPSDRIAFVQLQSLGLIELDAGNRRGAVPLQSEIYDIHGVTTTQLGQLLLNALREIDVAVRGGLDGA